MTSDRAGVADRSPLPARPPVWVYVADILVLGMLAVWLWVFLTGGARFRFGPVRVSLLSHWRVAILVVSFLAARHAVRLRPPFMAWLVHPLWFGFAQPCLTRLVRSLRAWPTTPFTLPSVPAPARWWQGAWGSLALLTSAWTVMTWPQVTGMSRLVSDPGDPFMKIWQLSWVANQILRDPLHLYDANIFFPEARTLAYSDAMIGPSVVVAPLLWAGVPGVLVFNLLMAAGFILSGVAMFALVRRLTADWKAGMVAGLAYAFLPYRFLHYSHVELQFTWGIPLALWALHRALETGRLRDGSLLGLVVGFQAACSLYYAAFLGVFLLGVGTVMWRGSPRRIRSARALAAGVLVAGLCAFPILRPYVANRASVGERGVTEVSEYSATPASYLAPGDRNRTYRAALGHFGEHEKRLFPGFLLFALAIVGAWPLQSVPRLAYVAGSVLAFDASLGTNGVTYPLLLEFVPAFAGFRVPARFGLLTATGLVVLAGYGVARLISLTRSPRARNTAVALMTIALMTEYRSFPLTFFEVPQTTPRVYDWLARLPETVIAEIPVSEEPDFSYMYWSRLHWHPLVNGQSGFSPRWYTEFQRAGRQFPDVASVAFLRSHRVRHVVVHRDLLRAGERDRFERRVAESAHLVRVVAVFTGSGDLVLEIR